MILQVGHVVFIAYVFFYMFEELDTSTFIATVYLGTEDLLNPSIWPIYIAYIFCLWYTSQSNCIGNEVGPSNMQTLTSNTQ